MHAPKLKFSFPLFLSNTSKQQKNTCKAERERERETALKCKMVEMKMTNGSTFLPFLILNCMYSEIIRVAYWY